MNFSVSFAVFRVAVAVAVASICKCNLTMGKCAKRTEYPTRNDNVYRTAQYTANNVLNYYNKAKRLKRKNAAIYLADRKCEIDYSEIFT